MLLADIQKAIQAEVLRAGGKLPTKMKLNHYINLAGQAFLIDTKLRRGNGIAATTSHAANQATGHHTFTTDTDTIEIDEVYYAGERLTETSREELGVFEPGWQSASDGTPHSYYVATGKRVRVFPPVALADIGKITTDLALGWTTNLTAASDDPAGDGRDLPEYTHIALVYWAANKFVPSAELQRHYQEIVMSARSEVMSDMEDMDDRAHMQQAQAQPQQAAG